jgi:hypothetical protein
METRRNYHEDEGVLQLFEAGLEGGTEDVAKEAAVAVAKLTRHYRGQLPHCPL